MLIKGGTLPPRARARARASNGFMINLAFLFPTDHSLDYTDPSPLSLIHARHFHLVEPFSLSLSRSLGGRAITELSDYRSISRSPTFFLPVAVFNRALNCNFSPKPVAVIHGAVVGPLRASIIGEIKSSLGRPRSEASRGPGSRAESFFSRGSYRFN